MQQKPFSKRPLWPMLFLLLFWPTACATNPVTGRQELMLLSESGEIQLGQETDAQVSRTYGIYNDPGLNAYVDRLGQRVAAGSHRSHLTFQFKVLDSPVINAFAVPGGYIYLTRGILAHLNSEAEVAGVIGHEIGHVAARHSAQQYTRATVAQIGLGLGTVLSEEFAALSSVAQFGVQMLFLKFSRGNERQADRLGVEYATRAGYDASALASFFHTLERLHPSSGAGNLPDWFSTHPAPEQRVTTVRALAVQQAQIHGFRQQELQVNQPAYFKQIDGLVFGEDPRQGYVDGDVFYHPELRFSFPVPSEWKLNNAPAQVQIVNPPKTAAILFSIDPEPTPERAARKFITETQAKVLTSGTTSINGLPATMLIADVTSGQRILRVMSVFISMDAQTYGFVGFCAADIFSDQRSAFERTMTGFSALSDPERIAITPDRVRILYTDSSTTVKDALKAQGVEEARLEESALLNGNELDDWVTEGTALKWVQAGNR